MAVFPFPTKNPQRSGWKEVLVSATITAPVDQGVSKKRARYSYQIYNYHCTYRLTTAERATFLTFFNTTLGKGVDNFDWDHPITGSTLQVRFKTEPNFMASGVDHLVNFILETDI